MTAVSGYINCKKKYTNKLAYWTKTLNYFSYKYEGSMFVFDFLDK